MTPEQLETAEQIVAYGIDKLRTVELQHQADPNLIFGELIGQLVVAEYKVQACAQAEAQLVQLIGAIWGGRPPAGVDHASTLKHAILLCEIVENSAGKPQTPEEAAHCAGAVEGQAGEGRADGN